MNYIDEAIESLNTLIDEVKYLRKCREENILLKDKIHYLEKAIKTIGAVEDVEYWVNRYTEEAMEDVPF